MKIVMAATVLTGYRHVQAFVAAELVSRQSSGFWIGLKNSPPQNRTYAWISGYYFDFTDWSANHTGTVTLEHADCSQVLWLGHADSSQVLWLGHADSSQVLWLGHADSSQVL